MRASLGLHGVKKGKDSVSSLQRTRVANRSPQPSRLALLGGNPLGAPPMDQHPTFSSETIARVVDLLEHGTTVGLSKFDSCISEAESALARWHEVDYCLGTSTGHAALHACLIGLEVTGGDEVITTPYSWGASVSCILLNNAIPVFADVDAETGLIDPASVEAAITPKTRAILVVHIFGQPADMTAICEVARKHGLAVIEDGSQAHGAVHHGRRVGSFGDAAGFSCMGAKLLASTEAGYLLTKDADVYWKACLSTQHLRGSPVRPGRAEEIGFPDRLIPFVDSLLFTYRLSTVNAILIAEQLKHIDKDNQGRQANAEWFKEALASLSYISFPRFPAGDVPTYHYLSFNFDSATAGVSRDTFIQALRAEGIAGAMAYVPVPLSSFPRLNPASAAPRTMWQDLIRQSGRRYASVSLPGCQRKIARSVELPWNYIAPDRDRMQRLADVFSRIDEQLVLLREWEKAH